MLINEQVSTVLVSNPIAHLPSISTDDMVKIMRIDKTKGSERIANYIVDAYDIINGQIPRICKTPQGWHRAQSCYVIGQGDMGQTVRAYKRAVMHEAAALMADDNIDYDTTSQGSIKSEAQLTKSDRLRRIVQHAIADMTGRRRNRVKLL